ncbi:MAG TPA: tol-pal system protein YbgF [Steroidobacteraceae bacterium]|nr:tol-pal system protein YbgF [Steroidobacteraceae bacterium]
MRSVTAALTLAALAAALGAGCATTPEEDAVLQARLTDLDARIARLERANQGQVEQAQRQEAEQAEVRELRGHLDQLEHDNAALRKQQHDLYADLDARVKALSAAGAAGGAGGAAGAAGMTAGGAAAGDTAGGGEPSSTEQAVYSQSFDALKAGSYSTAITGFRDFLKSYPQSPLAENAQYWLGEAYYVNHDYDSAAEAFRTVLKKYPDSRKAPDALLKLGFTQYEQKQYGAARATLTSVTQKYPGTDSAKLAADRLRRIPAQ